MTQVSVLDRWLVDKQSDVTCRAVLDLFRCYVKVDSFEDLLVVEDPTGRMRAWRDYLLSSERARSRFAPGSGPLSPGSVTAYLSHVRSFYRHFGVEIGYVPRIRKRVVLPHKILTKEEIRSMVEFGDVRDKAEVWVLYSSGARIRSVLGLNVGRIDLRAEPPVSLRFAESETKFNIPYTSFLCAEAVDAIRNYLRWRKRQGEKVSASSPLFINKYRKRLRYMSSKRALQRVQVRAGIEVGENERFAHHSFRAAFHRQLQVAGVNQYIIEKLMGHSTETTTTGRYSIGLTEEDLREAYSEAVWGLEVDEAKVLELEGKVNETQRTLGATLVENRQLLDRYEAALQEKDLIMSEVLKRLEYLEKRG